MEVKYGQPIMVPKASYYVYLSIIMPFDGVGGAEKWRQKGGGVKAWRLFTRVQWFTCPT